MFLQALNRWARHWTTSSFKRLTFYLAQLECYLWSLAIVNYGYMMVHFLVTRRGWEVSCGAVPSLLHPFSRLKCGPGATHSAGESNGKIPSFDSWMMTGGSPSWRNGAPPYESISGWWFGTFFIFPYVGNNHPNWLIFFRGVQTTNQIWVYWPSGEKKCPWRIFYPWKTCPFERYITPST